MFRILINLSYDGRDFYGWQKQPKLSPTVQGMLEEQLGKIFNTPIRIIGSGRTDRGAHALAQWCHADVPVDPTPLKLKRRLNKMTPDTLRVNEVFLAPKNFHAQRSSIKKKYIYRVYSAELPSPFELHYAYHLSTPIHLEILNRLSAHLCKTQDFKSFQNSGTDVETSVRTVFKAYWTQKGRFATFHIVGDGFLRQMVRNIVGTLLWCSYQENPDECFVNIINSLNRRLAKEPAPAHGLFLIWVKYPRELDNKCRKL
jgi:tRNA pseudouridine38-40 synthase